ncbi:uncharacterized protein LOC111701199, partial [Eurytemora carolleeae]|uniref:uncharacterized protein LOC111701199 n=1 Tax=Eurytemora carolleeae TaxID=1294199 RepID=UPI000C755E13
VDLDPQFSSVLQYLSSVLRYLPSVLQYLLQFSSASHQFSGNSHQFSGTSHQFTCTSHQFSCPLNTSLVPLISFPVPLISSPEPLIIFPVPLISSSVPLISSPVTLISSPVPLISSPVHLISSHVPLISTSVPLSHTLHQFYDTSPQYPQNISLCSYSSIQNSFCSLQPVLNSPTRGLKKGTRSRSEEGGRRLKTKLEDGDRLKPLPKSISQEKIAEVDSEIENSQMILLSSRTRHHNDCKEHLHSLHLSEPRIPPKEPYNPEIRNKNTSRVEWRKNRMKARQFPKLAHARETLNTVSVKKVRGKNGIIREEHDLLVFVDPDECYLTPSMITDLKEVFMLFDKDEDGVLIFPEIETVMKLLGLRPTDAELLYLVRQETEDRSYDTLEFNEFLKMLGKHFLGPVTRDKLLEAFRFFDKDEDGMIPIDELRNILTRLGERMPRKDLEELMARADSHGDGLIRYKDFSKIICKKRK